MRNMIKNMTSSLLFLVCIFLFASPSLAEAQSDIPNFSRSLVPYAIATPPASIPVTGIFQVPAGANSSIGPDNKQVIVTPNLNNQKGAIFSTEANRMDLSKNFQSLMYINLGDSYAAAADGMAFVMHNDPPVLSNFTMAVGAPLGVWSSDLGTLRSNIKKSFAVEFDTYRNGDGLDYNVTVGQSTNGHIAYSFPDQTGSYSGQGLAHRYLQSPTSPLSNGTWHKFEVSWDVATKTFYYKFDNLPKVPVVFDVAKIFGDTKVYWGFTGSTGGQKELNSVVFSEVPGLVSLTENMTNSTNSIVNWGSRSTIEMDYTYVDGIQNLLTPKFALTLDSNLSYVPSTLKINGVPADDSSWLDPKNLNLAFEELNLSNPTAKITFDVQASNVSKDVSSVITYNLNAGNYLGPAKTATMAIKAPKLQISQNTNNLTISSTELAAYKLLAPEEINAKIREKLGVAAIDTVTNSSDGILYVDYLSDGVTRLSSWIQSATAKPGASTAYKYKAGYYGTTANVTDVSVTGTLKISTVDLSITQKSSELLLSVGDIEKYQSLTNAQIEEDLRVKLGVSAIDKTSGDSVGITYNGFIKGSNDDLLGDAVKKSVAGTAINYYFVAQKTGITSATVEGMIRVNGGALSVDTFTDHSTFATSELSSKSTLVEREAPSWDFTIKDTRATGSPWKLSATASKMVDTEGRVLKGSIVYVDDKGQESVLDPIESTMLSSGSKAGDSTNVFGNWTKSSGILLKVDSGNLKGSYSGSIDWILSDVP